MINKLSKTGIYHIERGEGNQDVALSGENARFRIIALADGVSSCSAAAEGAQIACQSAIDLFLENGALLLKYPPGQIARLIIGQVLHLLRARAAADNREIADYSSTLAIAALDKKSRKLLFFNLGDGLILSTKGEIISVLCPPSDSRYGCCVTTTEHADSMAQCQLTESATHDSVYLFSDGGWQPLYDWNILKPEVRGMITRRDFSTLDAFLNKCASHDDSSYISMSI